MPLLVSCTTGAREWTSRPGGRNKCLRAVLDFRLRLVPDQVAGPVAECLGVGYLGVKGSPVHTRPARPRKNIRGLGPDAGVPARSRHHSGNAGPPSVNSPQCNQGCRGRRRRATGGSYVGTFASSRRPRLVLGSLVSVRDPFGVPSHRGDQLVGSGVGRIDAQ